MLNARIPSSFGKSLTISSSSKRFSTESSRLLHNRESTLAVSVQCPMITAMVKKHSGITKYIEGDVSDSVMVNTHYMARGLFWHGHVMVRTSVSPTDRYHEVLCPFLILNSVCCNRCSLSVHQLYLIVCSFSQPRDKTAFDQLYY